MVLFQGPQHKERCAIQVQHNKSDQAGQQLQPGLEAFALLYEGC